MIVETTVGFLILVVVVGLMIICTLALLIIRELAAVRKEKLRRGRCLKRGYDLRGELDAGCPECGWGRESSEAGCSTAIMGSRFARQFGDIVRQHRVARG